MLMQAGNLEYAQAIAKPRVQEAKGELLRRAQFLLDGDRKILEMSLGQGIPNRQIGRWIDQEPGTVARRIARLVIRLNDPLVVALVSDHCPLPSDYRTIGIERFVQGIPELYIAQKHQMSRREVSNILNYIRGWHRGISMRRSF